MVGHHDAGGPVGFVQPPSGTAARAWESRSAIDAGAGVGVGDRVGDIGLAFCQPVDQLRQRRHRLVELVALFAQRSEHGVEVVDDLADQQIAVGQGVGQRCGLVRNDPIVAPWP